MTPALLEAVLAHARAEVPRECCGLLLLRPGQKEAEYVPCRNIGPMDNFILDPIDWANCEDAGDVLGVVHSHPAGKPRPSEADKKFQKFSGLPWWIVVPETGEWIRFGAAPLHGRRFCWGIQDCYTLVADSIGGMPEFIRDVDCSLARDLFSDYMNEAGFHKVAGEPQPGDIYVFRVKDPYPDHCAVVLGAGQMLHQPFTQLSREVQVGKMVEKLVYVARRNNKANP